MVLNKTKAKSYKRKCIQVLTHFGTEDYLDLDQILIDLHRSIRQQTDNVDI